MHKLSPTKSAVKQNAAVQKEFCVTAGWGPWPVTLWNNGLSRSGGELLLDCRNSVGCIARVRTAGLGHVRPPAAALAAHGRRSGAHQVHGADARGEVIGD